MVEAGLQAFRREVAVGVDAAQLAVEAAESRVGAADVSIKDGRDVVTAADVSVENLVRRVLGNGLGQPVVGEEHGGVPPADGAGYWLVDPICGTRNYASGMPLYCVNLAYVEADEVVAAVVADPSTSEIVVAERGRGAWVHRDGALDRIATTGDSRTIVVEVGKASGARREQAAAFAAAAIRADRWDFRALGTTLSLPYVARGRVAAYALFGITALHSAAGSLLVTEAGGVVSDVDGHPWTLDSSTMLATADARLHDDLLALIAPG